MGKFNEIKEQTTQSYGSNSFTTRIKETTVEFDSAKDKFTFLDPVEAPNLIVNGQESVAFTSADRTKLDNLQTPMQIQGRVDSVSDLPTEDVAVGDTYLVGLSGSETFDEYVCVELSGSPEAPVWESVGSTQVQADWNQNDSTAVDYIKNKPTIPSAQVPADWNQNDSSAADYIKNRICYDGRDTVVYAQATIGSDGYILNGEFNITQPFAAETYEIVIGDYEETTSVTLEQDGQVLGGGFTLTQGSGSVVYTIGENTVVISVSSNPALYANKTLKVGNISGEIVTIDAKYLGFFVQQGTGSNSIIENNQINVASGTFSHSEGSGTTASGEVSHSEGSYNTASGNYSHSEGNWTTASGESSHSEGNETSASGYYSHSEGNHTIANHKSQHTFGEYNIEDSSTASSSSRGNYVEIVGNGDFNTRSNARTLDWSGNEVLSGTLTTTGVSTKKLTISSIDPTDVFMHSEIIDASSDVAFSRVIANTSSSKTDGYVEILYKASSGVTCSAYIDSADVTLTADGAWHKLEQGCDPADGVEIHINNSAPVTDATLEVISKVYYI